MRQILFEQERAEAGRMRDHALATAQEAEQRAASALQSMERAQAAAHYGTWAIDHTSNLLTGSAENWKINELDSGPPGGRDAFELRVHPDDLMAVRSAFTDSVKRRVSCSIECRLLFPDGRVKWVAITAHHTYGADGAVAHTVGTTQDITERKTAEAEIARKNALLEEAEATAHLGSWTSDATWTQMTWTPEMWRIVGLEPKAGGPDNSDLLQALDEADRGKLQRALTEAMDNPTLASHPFDVRVVRPNGDVRDVQLDVNFKRDAAGQFVGAQGTLLDVTERARAQREIHKKSVALERAEEVAHLGSWDLDLTTNTLTWSAEIYRLYGVDPATPATVDLFFSLIHPEDRAGLVEVLRVSSQPGSLPVTRDFRILRGGKEVRFQHGELRSEKDPQGKVLHIHGVVQDTTDQRVAEAKAREADAANARAQALEQAERERTIFINAMAHELNNPLTPLQLQLKVLQMETQGPLTDAQKHAVAMLDRNVHRMGSLVRDLLDVARIQARQLKIEPRPTDIGALCREVTHTYEPQAIEKGIELTVAGTDGCVAHVDSSRIVQVLNNLVSNALKFSSTGAKVHVSHGPHDNQVEVTVRDDGPGLTAQQIEALFKPFSQVLGEKQAGKGGLGLGLYISKGIVERHGGRIWAESDGPGTGSTFRFTLPASGPVPTDAPKEARPKVVALAGW
ncbi:MAG: sensor histidine kinase [Thermoplasmatota archaeon]